MCYLIVNGHRTAIWRYCVNETGYDKADILMRTPSVQTTV